jgi:HD-like signal output (HDOD) protein
MSATATLEGRDAIRNAVRKISTIATLPEVVAQIVATVEDPKSSAAQLHKIVSHDPALVTRILKVVNSAFYGLPGQINSIERAIVMLGLNAVKNIAVAASLGQLFRGVKLCEGYTARDLWTHCIAVAVTARDLAKQMRWSIADEAFLAGMVHDVGLLIEMQLAPEKLARVCEIAKTSAQSFSSIERDKIGMDHEMVGEALAEMWKFPKACQIVAGNHHSGKTASEDHRKLLTLIHIADILVCATPGTGFPLTAKTQTYSDETLAAIGLTPQVVESTKSRIPELLGNASMLL